MSRILILLLRGYKTWLSPLLPPACRYEPTCSIYAIEAIELYGPWRGSWLALRRILRCHPFARGGFDPVPVPGVTNERADRAPRGETPGR